MYQFEYEDLTLKEFLETASEEVVQACKFAGLSDGKIITSEITDQVPEYLKYSTKLKDFGDNTSVWVAPDGSMLVYHYEAGIQALYLS